MTLDDVLTTAIAPAIEILGSQRYDSREARVMLLAIGLQETGFATRVQHGNGPGRSFWQFEQGGVNGIYGHPRTCDPLMRLASARGVVFTPLAIYRALLSDDVLGAGCARLLLFSDAAALPSANDPLGGWKYYLRNWRPGKPRPEAWPVNYANANSAVQK